MKREHAKHHLSEAANLSELPRREWIKGTLGLGAVAALSGCASMGEPSRSDLVRRENQKPGTRDWTLKNTRIDPSTKYRCPWIEGYCSHTSVRAGDRIQFFVSTNCMQYGEGAGVVEQRIEFCDEQHFKRLIVYCFITGDFAMVELESFVAVFAASTGTAPRLGRTFTTTA